MRLPFKRLRRWTDPDGILAPAYAHMSYALFCLDSRPDGTPGPLTGRILAARSPDESLWRVGIRLPDLTDLTPDAYRFLLTGRFPPPTPSEDPRPTEDPARPEPGSLFVWTRTGLGLLSRCFARTADLGLLVHLHVDPLSGARLLTGSDMHRPGNGCALSSRIRCVTDPPTERDMPTFTVMNDARMIVRPIRDGFARAPQLPPGQPAAVPIAAISRLASFVGCTLTLELDGHPVMLPETFFEPEHVCLESSVVDGLVCHSPNVLELLLLGLFSEVRTCARHRTATCRMTSGRLWAAPSLLLDYDPVPTLTPLELDALLDLRAYLAQMADRHGMALSATPVPLASFDLHPLRQIVALDWLADPTLLPTSDLKTRLWLRDADTEPRA